MRSQLGPSPRPDLPPTLQEPPRWPPPVQCTSSHLPGPLATTGQSPPSSPSCQPGPWKAPEATWVCSQVRKRGGHEAQPLGSSSLGLRQSEPPSSQVPRHSCGCGRSQQGPACRAAQPPSRPASARTPVSRPGAGGGDTARPQASRKGTTVSPTLPHEATPSGFWGSLPRGLGSQRGLRTSPGTWPRLKASQYRCLWSPSAGELQRRRGPATDTHGDPGRGRALPWLPTGPPNQFLPAAPREGPH